MQSRTRRPALLLPVGAPPQHRSSVIVLLTALLLGACVSVAPPQRETSFSSSVGCRAEVVMHELLGRFPGVQVSRQGNELRTRIRDALQEPLYVIDGLPLAPGSGILSAVNPCDIQEIRVLSNPADLTFYGLRGANGVILITTRRPMRSDG